MQESKKYKNQEEKKGRQQLATIMWQVRCVKHALKIPSVYLNAILGLGSQTAYMQYMQYIRLDVQLFICILYNNL